MTFSKLKKEKYSSMTTLTCMTKKGEQISVQCNISCEIKAVQIFFGQICPNFAHAKICLNSLIFHHLGEPL